MKTQDQELLEEAYEQTELNSFIHKLFKQLEVQSPQYKEEYLKAKFKKWVKIDPLFKKELESDLNTLLP